MRSFNNSTCVSIIQKCKFQFAYIFGMFLFKCDFPALSLFFLSACHKIFAYLNVRFSKCWKQQALVCSWVILYSSICLVSAAIRAVKWPRSSLAGRKNVGSMGSSLQHRASGGLGGPSVHGSFRTCFLPVEFFQRQISKGNKYWVMTTECIFGTC